jgi:hypothetical protein
MAEIGNFSALTPTTTYASFNSPYYAPIGSTAGAGTPNPSFSTITVSPDSASDPVALTINPDLVNGGGGYIGFINNGYVGSIGTDTNANMYIANGNQGQYGSGVLNFLSYSTITMNGGFPNVTPSTLLSVDDIVCRTINGSVPGSGSFISSISNANATVECTTSSVIQATGDFIINTASAGFINNTTSTGANLYIGSTDGATPSNIIYANTSTLACQYNLTCQLLNGLAPPVVYGTNQVIITPGNLTTNFNLPPLSGAGYTWVANVTPFGFIVGANPTWSCQVAGDVLTVSINNVQAGNVQFNTIASAYK